jgi:hypothetical protein
MNSGIYDPRSLCANPTAALLLLVFSFSTECVLLGQGIVDFENFSNTQISTNSTHNGPATGLMSGAAETYYFVFSNRQTKPRWIPASLDGPWLASIDTTPPPPGL